MENDDVSYFVADVDGKIVGVSKLTVYGKSGHSHLGWICIHPSEQGHGYGEKLMRKVLDRCKEKGCHKVSLFTFDKLKSAISLYSKLGFVVEARLEKHFWKVDFLLMSKWFDQHEDTRKLHDYIDTNTKGPRYDVTPIFENIEVFNKLITQLTSSIKDDFDKVLGIDALGFILGTGISIRMNKGFIPLRKGGKFPGEVDKVDFVDYTGNKKSLEIRKGIIEKGTRVLIVDEWIETGAQIKASIELIERQGGVVVGIASINIDDTDENRKLREKYPCYTLNEID